MNISKKIMINSLFVLFAIVVSMIPGPVFADHSTAAVSLPQGTSITGCETTNECFIPSEVTVDIGGEVTWSNDDSAAHTVTAGSAAVGPSGVFDSSLFMAGTTFSHTFEAKGVFPYFCIVHPWMEGIVLVQGVEEAEPAEFESKGIGSEESEYAPGTLVVRAPSEEETTVSGISADGTIRAEITASNPISDEKMSLEIKFRDSNDGSVKEHANYDLVITQNDLEILSVFGEHAHEGTSIYLTPPLRSSDQVDIKVTMLGFGLPDEESNWSGPQGEILIFNVVPEFGTVAIVVMFVAISAVVLMSSKYTRVIPKL
ncbi:MAG: plastocyanin/azurin family copper-binding protein [Nitrosopumilus sp.]|nr:plastocyanin/azurin family copper-binding protein [Nitrosopumilus sp.]